MNPGMDAPTLEVAPQGQVNCYSLFCRWCFAKTCMIWETWGQEALESLHPSIRNRTTQRTVSCSFCWEWHSPGVWAVLYLKQYLHLEPRFLFWFTCLCVLPSNMWECDPNTEKRSVEISSPAPQRNWASLLKKVESWSLVFCSRAVFSDSGSIFTFQKAEWNSCPRSLPLKRPRERTSFTGVEDFLEGGQPCPSLVRFWQTRHSRMILWAHTGRTINFSSSTESLIFVQIHTQFSANAINWSYSLGKHFGLWCVCPVCFQWVVMWYWLQVAFLHKAKITGRAVWPQQTMFYEKQMPDTCFIVQFNFTRKYLVSYFLSRFFHDRLWRNVFVEEKQEFSEHRTGKGEYTERNFFYSQDKNKMLSLV